MPPQRAFGPAPSHETWGWTFISRGWSCPWPNWQVGGILGYFQTCALSEDFADEGDEIGASGTAERPTDLGADETWTRGASNLEGPPSRVIQTLTRSPAGASHWSGSFGVRHVNVGTAVEAGAPWGWRQMWTDLSLVLPIPQCLVIIIDCCICELTRVLACAMSGSCLPGWVGHVHHIAPVTAALEFPGESTDGTPGRFFRLELAGLFHCRWTQRGRLQGMAGGGAIGEGGCYTPSKVGWLPTLP